MTVAEDCSSNFEKAWSLAETEARQFETFFDNVTLLRKTGVTDGIDDRKPNEKCSNPDHQFAKFPTSITVCLVCAKSVSTLSNEQ
jgi:hypothetical protein